MTDFPDWQQPQANATAISTTGVPLLRGTANLGKAVNQSIGPGAVVQLLTTAAVGQPGYEGMFSLSGLAGGGSIPFASLIFNWFDQATGLNVFSRFQLLTAGNGAANALQYYVYGPCHGNQLSVQITNLDPTITMTLTWGINQTSHVFELDRISQPVYATTAPNGFTNPGGVPGLGVLALSTPVLAAGGTANRLLAVRNGPALLSVDNGAQANTVRVSLDDPNQLYGGTLNQHLHIHTVAAGLRDYTEVVLPYGPVLLSLNNTGTSGSITPAIALTVLDQ